MLQKCIPLESPLEWKEALEGIRHSFAHTWENCYAMHLTTHFKTFLYCFEKDNIRIVCPIAERVFEGYTDIVTPYGFSGFVGNGDHSEFPDYWNDFTRQRGYVCGYIQLNPIFENATYFSAREAHQYNTVYVLDLTLSIEEIISRLGKTRKKEVKNLDGAPHSILLDKDALTDFFLKNYSAFFLRKNASRAYNFSRETASFICGLDNVMLVGVGRPGKVEAMSVLAHTPHAGEGLFQISLAGGQRYAVALVWYRINYLKSLRIPLFNLGGGVRENDGIARFKARFGAMRLPLKCLKQVYRPYVYERLCKEVNIDPKDTTGYFPSYRKA